MTIEDLEELLKSQKGKCGICAIEVTEYTCVVDHDHNHGHVRGALCPNCNIALGHLKDDRTNVRRALYYLTKHKREEV